jgi:hypothetical protein
MNVKQLSDSDILDKVTIWSEKCRTIYRLDFNARSRIKYDIRSLRRAQHLGKFYTPQSLDKLHRSIPELYALLRKEGIMC